MKEFHIARVILDQIGDFRFLQATNAEYHFSTKAPHLRILLPAPGANGINRVDVTLTPWDTYRMTFINMHSRNGEFIAETVAEHGDVYCDELMGSFQAETGIPLPYDVYDTEEGPRLMPSDPNQLQQAFDLASAIVFPLFTDFFHKNDVVVWGNPNLKYPNTKFKSVEQPGVYIGISRPADTYTLQIEKVRTQDKLTFHVSETVQSNLDLDAVKREIRLHTGDNLYDRDPAATFKVTWGDPVIRKSSEWTMQLLDWRRAYLSGEAVHMDAFLTLLARRMPDTYLVESDLIKDLPRDVSLVCNDGTFETVEQGVHVPDLPRLADILAKSLRSMAGMPNGGCDYE